MAIATLSPAVKVPSVLSTHCSRTIHAPFAQKENANRSPPPVGRRRGMREPAMNAVLGIHDSRPTHD
jgi:hypothetical protein